MKKYITAIRIRKILYLFLFSLIFFQIFINNPFDNWQKKYKAFNVPAYVFPGADSRNIQKTAYCHSKGYDYYNNKKCYNYTNLISKVYSYRPQPKYNYPPIVAKMYEFFNDYSEEFFQKFWLFNMLLLLFTVLLYSYKINYLLFPVVVFSPIFLLEVERANIDGIVFSILFLPLLITTSVFLHTLFIGIATSIKLFPVFSFLALYRKKLADIKKKIFAILLVSPLIISTLFCLKTCINGTQYSFDKSFGLFSLRYAKFLHNYTLSPNFIIIIYLLISLIMVFLMYKNKYLSKSLLENIKGMEEKYLNIFLITLIIYICVFLFFTSWAYRFIFLIPVFLILSNIKDVISRITFILIFITFIIPFLPNGWIYFNIMNYILFPFLLTIFIIAYKYHYYYEEKNI